MQLVQGLLLVIRSRRSEGKSFEECRGCLWHSSAKGKVKAMTFAPCKTWLTDCAILNFCLHFLTTDFGFWCQSARQACFYSRSVWYVFALCYQLCTCLKHSVGFFVLFPVSFLFITSRHGSGQPHHQHSCREATGQHLWGQTEGVPA